MDIQSLKYGSLNYLIPGKKNKIGPFAYPTNLSQSFSLPPGQRQQSIDHRQRMCGIPGYEEINLVAVQETSVQGR